MQPITIKAGMKFRRVDTNPQWDGKVLKVIGETKKGWAWTWDGSKDIGMTYSYLQLVDMWDRGVIEQLMEEKSNRLDSVE